MTLCFELFLQISDTILVSTPQKERVKSVKSVLHEGDPAEITLGV